MRITYPKAKAVTAHATTADEAAAARVSVRHDLMWYAPDSFDVTPMTPARIAKTRK